MQPSNFHILAKPIGPICNLNCKYCFYLEKENLYPEVKKWAMPDDVLENFIRQYIAAQDSDTVSFTWQGGEPTLLKIPYFEKIIALQKKYADGKLIQNAFQTNGVLLNVAWGEFLAKNNFLIGLSIDGPKALNDAYRRDKGDHSYFDKLMRGLEALKRNNVEFNTLTTVHRGNVDHPLEIYNFLKEIGSSYQQYIPIVERRANAPTTDGLDLVSSDYELEAQVTEWSVNPRKYGRFLCDIFDAWVKEDVGKVFVQLFDISLQMWAGMPSGLCLFHETCGTAGAIEHNGDVYSCDHFVYPQNKLGNIMEGTLGSMMGSDQQTKFGHNKWDNLPEYCRKCEVRFACNGECPKHRFLETPDGEPGLNYLCAAYKKYFTHIYPYMRFMVMALNDGFAPATVMKFARAELSDKGIGRNDPCPCGSGKKFKQCCQEKWNIAKKH